MNGNARFQNLDDHIRRLRSEVTFAEAVRNAFERARMPNNNWSVSVSANNTIIIKYAPGIMPRGQVLPGINLRDVEAVVWGMAEKYFDVMGWPKNTVEVDLEGEVAEAQRSNAANHSPLTIGVVGDSVKVVGVWVSHIKNTPMTDILTKFLDYGAMEVNGSTDAGTAVAYWQLQRATSAISVLETLELTMKEHGDLE